VQAVKSAVAAHRDGGGVLSVAISRCRKPVIAAINGTAVGGGVTPTLACDMRVVSADAKIGFVFARRGIVPEGCSSYYLTRLVGIGQANEWVMTGRLFKATEAAGTGLFNYILPRSEVVGKAHALAREIVDNCSPSSVTLSKFMLAKQLDVSSPEEALLLESRLLSWAFRQPDAKEGTVSFMQKRLPNFRTTGELPDDFPWWPSVDVKSRL
jgi:enoyl-CoA hydratase/carnithine racemase